MVFLTLVTKLVPLVLVLRSKAYQILKLLNVPSNFSLCSYFYHSPFFLKLGCVLRASFSCLHLRSVRWPWFLTFSPLQFKRTVIMFTVWSWVENSTLEKIYAMISLPNVIYRISWNKHTNKTGLWRHHSCEKCDICTHT